MEDFVVVIPDCFNPEVPLSGHVPLSVRRRDGDTDTPLTRSTESCQEGPSEALGPMAGQLVFQESSSSEDPQATAAPPHAFVPDRLTLKRVKEGGLFHPLAVATGLVNTVADMVQEKVHVAPVKKPLPPSTPPTAEEEHSEEEYEVSARAHTHVCDTGLCTGLSRHPLCPRPC